MSREEFWELSPRELYREMDAARERRQDELDRDLVLAWHIAKLQRVERIPALKTLITRRTEDKPPTKAQQQAVMHILSAQLGIPLRKVARG